MNCDVPSLTSAFNDGTEQWTDALAQQAWNDAVTGWKIRTTGLDANFGDWVIDYFHGRSSTHCDQIDNGNCQTTVVCGQGTSANAEVNSPAG